MLKMLDPLLVPLFKYCPKVTNGKFYRKEENRYREIQTLRKEHFPRVP